MENTKSKNYCPSCRKDTNHSLLFNQKQSTQYHEEDYRWSKLFQVIQCDGCESIQYREVYSDETMIQYDEEGNLEHFDEISYYPPFLKINSILENSYHIPQKIRIVYHETIQAFKAKSYLLSGVGFRAVIEAICIQEGIKGKNLEQKILNLLKNKLITDKESNRLHSIRFLGNDSVHEMVVPSEKKLYIVLNIIEHLLNNLYIIDKEAKSELDTIIDNYEDFSKLISLKIEKLKEGEEKSLKEILEKNIRRISSDNLAIFTETLISKIDASTLKWIAKGELKAIAKDLTPIQHFKKIEELF